MSHPSPSEPAVEDAAPPISRVAPASSAQQAMNHLLRLAAQVELLQQQVGGLQEMARHSSAHLETLTRHLTDPSSLRTVEERLADLLTRLDASQDQVEEIADSVKKLNRTQFKANTLAEAQEQRLADALATLQELATRRETAQEERTQQEQQRLTEARTQARGEMAADLLPALDGLEHAIESGRALLARRPTHPPARPATSFLHKLNPATSQESSSPGDESLAAWLTGLELVRERFLGLLAAAGVQRIPALRAPFDPRLHVAMEAMPRPDVPPGTVVRVLRQGYRQGERVLRYAEVAVAKAVER